MQTYEFSAYIFVPVGDILVQAMNVTLLFDSDIVAACESIMIKSL